MRDCLPLQHVRQLVRHVRAGRVRLVKPQRYFCAREQAPDRRAQPVLIALRQPIPVDDPRNPQVL